MSDYAWLPGLQAPAVGGSVATDESSSFPEPDTELSNMPGPEDVSEAQLQMDYSSSESPDDGFQHDEDWTNSRCLVCMPHA